MFVLRDKHYKKNGFIWIWRKQKKILCLRITENLGLVDSKICYNKLFSTWCQMEAIYWLSVTDYIFKWNSNNIFFIFWKTFKLISFWLKEKIKWLCIGNDKQDEVEVSLSINTEAASLSFTTEIVHYQQMNFNSNIFFCWSLVNSSLH